MSAPSPIESIVARILGGEAPANVRDAAARGALPLPRATLIQLYVFLLEDRDESVRQSARQSLQGLEEPAVLEALGDSGCPVPVLEHFATKAARHDKLAERIAFHPDVSAAALATLASGGSASVIDLVLTNQERLLRYPSVLEKLMNNPLLRADQRGRILEMLDRATREAASRKTEGETEGTGGEADVEEVSQAARLLDVDVGELLSVSQIADGEEFEMSEDPDIRSAYQKIVTLNTAQKAVLAMKGGREERLILIRDTNKVVALAVLKNGRITEQEVESIARMRNVSDEVLRLVGTNREWTKNYAVAVALVRNPRTPQGVATNFISRLSNRDLKELSRSREIPELIRRMARRTYDLRTQPQTSKFKKK